MSIQANKQIFSIPNLECDKVVVFQDRAEVRRVIKATLKKGENEIAINSITHSIDKDSVRVEGHGDASVLDVVCENKFVQSNDVENSQKIKELNLEIKNLQLEKEQAKLKLARIDKQTNILNDFANTLAKPTAKDGQNESIPSSKQNVDNFLAFITTFSSKSEELDDQKFKIENELKEIEEKLKVLTENRLKLSSVSNTNSSTEITILIETSKEQTEINLFLSYVVNNAYWTPKYDIRVFSKDKSMTLNYFGLITQSTGEDWNDTKLSLSTAVPSIGGNVPKLDTLSVSFESAYIYSSMRSRSKYEADTLCSAGLADFDYEPKKEFKKSKTIDFLQTEVESSNIGTTFTYSIPRKATIPSDGKSHKVSIGIIGLKPEFEYETVPKKNPHAYIKAKVTNTSQYSLLAGPANVFLDNNFVAKTDLKSYSPQEEFNCSLGVDPAIRIDYKPLRKFKTHSGLLSKTITTTYVQVIEIKNTTQNQAKLLLSENLPLSNDEKIQVKLLEPNLKNQSFVRLNKSNNLEFELEIDSSKTREIIIKYTIEHPSNKPIHFD